MSRTTYILKSGGGRAVFSADDVTTAKDHAKKALERGVRLRVFETTTTEKEIVL